MSLIDLIQFEKNNGSMTNQMIADYILTHIEDISEQKLKEIADNTYSSRSSLVRFAQKIGLSGWKELIFELKAYMSQKDHDFKSTIDANFPFAQLDNTSTIIKKLRQVSVDSLDLTVDEIIYAEVEAAAKMLDKANQVILFGVSPNDYYAHIFKRKMLSIGKSCYVSVNGENGVHIGAMTEEDIAIFVSYSGNAIEDDTTRILDSLVEKRVPIIAITSKGHNTLRNKVLITFTIASEERLSTKISTFSTETSIMLIFNILFATFFNLAYDQNVKFRLEQAQQLEMSRVSESLD